MLTICAISWAIQYISVRALVYYMKKKGYTEPDDAELHECTQWVIKQMFLKECAEEVRA